MSAARRIEEVSELPPSRSGEHRIEPGSTSRLARVRLEELLDECEHPPPSIAPPTLRPEHASVDPVVLPELTTEDLVDDDAHANGIASAVRESRLAAAAAASVARSIAPPPPPPPPPMPSQWPAVSALPLPFPSSASFAAPSLLMHPPRALGNRPLLSPEEKQAVRVAREVRRRALADARRAKVMVGSLCCFAVVIAGLMMFLFSSST